MREIVVLPAPEGEERTNISPRRLRALMGAGSPAMRAPAPARLNKSTPNRGGGAQSCAIFLSVLSPERRDERLLRPRSNRVLAINPPPIRIAPGSERVA